MQWPFSKKFGTVTLVLMVGLPAFGQEDDTTSTQNARVEPSGEIKIFTDLTIPEGEIRSGNLRVIGGDLTVAGTVTGRITVIGGAVEILPTATIEGSIYALGGKINRDPGATVTGQVIEVNRGKVSMSRSQAEDIFGDDTSLEWRYKGDWGDDDWDDDRDNCNGHSSDYDGRHYSFTPGRSGDYNAIRPDFEVPFDHTFRYNRSEGVAIYVPFSPDTHDMPGFKIHSYAGYAFGPHRWYGRLAVGEFLFNNRLGVIAEAHSEPRNDDQWRVLPLENFLGAFLLHEDWFDWYETEGFGGSLILNGPLSSHVKVQYRNETHALMPNTTNWSLFGGDKQFRPGFDITPGKDVNLAVHADIGHAVGPFHRGITAGAGIRYVQTLEESDFDYTRQDANVDLFMSLHPRLGIQLSVRGGAIESDLDAGGYGNQHMTPLGGLGSVSGYDYKSFGYNTSYGLIKAAFVLRKHHDFMGLLWNYGNSWDGTAGLLSSDYLEGIQDGGAHSVGIGFGGDDVRFEFYKPLSKEHSSREWVMYFRLVNL